MWGEEFEWERAGLHSKIGELNCRAGFSKKSQTTRPVNRAEPVKKSSKTERSEAGLVVGGLTVESALPSGGGALGGDAPSGGFRRDLHEGSDHAPGEIHPRRLQEADKLEAFQITMRAWIPAVSLDSRRVWA